MQVAALKKLQQKTIGFVSLLLNSIECFISLVFQGLDNHTDNIQWTTNKCLRDFKPKQEEGRKDCL